MDIRELKDVAIELMDAVKARGLGGVEIEAADARILIRAREPAPVMNAQGAAACPSAPADAAAPAMEEAAPAPADGLPAGTRVEAPLVGVFYSAPTPDAPPFVLVGQKVKKGDTLFIIEAMKTMNEIKAPCDGTVARILAQTGDLVEYKQVVAVIEE